MEIHPKNIIQRCWNDTFLFLFQDLERFLFLGGKLTVLGSVSDQLVKAGNCCLGTGATMVAVFKISVRCLTYKDI